MAMGILGRKLGMTQVFSEDGKRVAVTVVEAGPCTVMIKRTVKNDGYEAVQLGFEERKEKHTRKPQIVAAQKAGQTPKRYTREFRLDNGAVDAYEVGTEIKADIFEIGEMVNLVGTSKGKGFQGNIKRHGHKGGPASHGSKTHRRPGSLGCRYPQRVRKGLKMPGQMGSKRITTKNLEVIEVMLDKNVLLLKGSVPGANGNYVMIKKQKG